MKPFTRIHSRKLFHFEKSGNITKPLEMVDSNLPDTLHKAEPMVNSCYQNESKRNSELDATADMKNNSAILSGLNESLWSYENYGFRSLPTRGNKKNVRPGIKFMINSETVSQTKKLVYREHQRSQDLPPSNSLITDNENLSKSNSSISLNSNDNPEIVAALDQIASEMGLIEHPVMRHSNDPINYLLATRSFSERISTTKLISDNYCDKPRPNSHISHSNSRSQLSVPTKDVKENISVTNGQQAHGSKKIKDKISKIIEKFSPKAIRRSKSNPGTIPNSSLPERNKLQNNIYNKTNHTDIEKTVHILSAEPKNFNFNNSNNTPNYVNDTSKRLLNSLKIDRIEQPQDKFRTISKRRNENTNQPSVEICKRDLLRSPDIIDKRKILENEKLNGKPQCELRRPSTANARYVNVSLCAFGYGPHQSAYKSPIDRGSINFEDDQQISNLISLHHNDHSSISDDATTNSISTDL